MVQRVTPPQWPPPAPQPATIPAPQVRIANRFDAIREATKLITSGPDRCECFMQGRVMYVRPVRDR
jgi:hypothetical protein